MKGFQTLPIDKILIPAKRWRAVDDDHARILATSIEEILATVETEKPDILIIDSIQTMYSEEVSSAPGIYCPQELIDFGLLPSESSEPARVNPTMGIPFPKTFGTFSSSLFDHIPAPISFSLL